MKHAVALALALLVVPARARADKNVVLTRSGPGFEEYAVADKALAKMFFSKERTCSDVSKKETAYYAAYGAVSAQDATWEALRDMSAALRELQTLREACGKETGAVKARVDALVGPGSGDRIESGTVFEGKVYLRLKKPLPPPPPPKAEDYEYRGGGCP